MYTKEQIQGMLLTIANPEVTVYKSNDSYGVRLRVLFRATNIHFLNALQRTLYQYRIKSILKDRESKQRNLPMLMIGDRGSIRRLINIIPNNVPKSHNNWDLLIRMLEAIEEGKHLNEDGIIEMKEWYDDNKKQRKTNIISG
jgi:hypothetical protein